MNYGDDFKKYALSQGIGSGDMHRMGTHLEANLTPYILEERKMNVTQMDVFSRLMSDRILWVSGAVNDNMSSIVSAQMMYLDMNNEKDISIYLDSPGGSVKSGLTMVDVMNYVGSEIVTINMGMAASMGSILLGNGTKGKRFSLPHAKVMLHMVSAGVSGHVKDMEIGYEEAKKYNDELFKLLGDYCDKTAEEIKGDADRDLWLNSRESLEYGIIDGVFTTKDGPPMTREDLAKK